MKRVILAFSCVIVAAAPLLAQVQKGSLANLIQSGNRKAALERIRAGADVNEAQPDGTRPIHWAVYKVDYELLDALIAKKAKVDVANEFGATPIAEAAKLADARMVKSLLDAGAGPEGANEDGETALMLAIKTGELPVVELLLKAGAKVNEIEKYRHQTPLMWAAAAPRNADEMVKLLLSKGADVKVRASYNDWPSQITSEPRAQYRPVGGLTALLYAARGGCYDCVDQLIGAGADPNMPTPEGVTPLMMALDNDQTDVAKLLLDRGANPNLWDWWGRTALYIVIDRKEGGSSGGLRSGAAALRNPEPPPAPIASRPGRAPASYLEIVNALLAEGVDPSPELNMHRPGRGGNSGRFIDPLMSTGCTPLVRAALGGDAEVVRALLDKGASPNVDAMGMTAFLVAAGVGSGARGGTGPADPSLMDLMLQHGADVNAQVTGTLTYSMRISRAPSANEGMTALHVAAQAGRADLVRYLLAHGARTDIGDASGRKAIDLVDAGARAAGSLARPAGSTNPGTSAPAITGSPRPPGIGGAAGAGEIRDLLLNATAKQ